MSKLSCDQLYCFLPSDSLEAPVIFSIGLHVRIEYPAFAVDTFGIAIASGAEKSLRYRVFSAPFRGHDSAPFYMHVYKTSIRAVSMADCFVFLQRLSQLDVFPNDYVLNAR